MNSWKKNDNIGIIYKIKGKDKCIIDGNISNSNNNNLSFNNIYISSSEEKYLSDFFLQYFSKIKSYDIKLALDMKPAKIWLLQPNKFRKIVLICNNNNIYFFKTLESESSLNFIKLSDNLLAEPFIDIDLKQLAIEEKLSIDLLDEKSSIIYLKNKVNYLEEELKNIKLKLKL